MSVEPDGVPGTAQDDGNAAEGGATMGEAGHQPVGGERRRRREAERAAAEAAERAGIAPPSTRRELHRRRLEEGAGLEASASGELHLGPAGTDELGAAGRETTTNAPPDRPDRGTVGNAAPATGSPSRRSLRGRLDAPAQRPDDATTGDASAAGRRPVVRTPATATGIRRLDATGRLTGVQPAVRPAGEPDHPLTAGRTTPVPPDAGSTLRRRTVGRPTDANTGTSDPTAWDDAVTGVGEIIAVSPESAQAADASASPAGAPSSPANAVARPTPSTPVPVPSGEVTAPATQVTPSGTEATTGRGEPPRPQWAAISGVPGASADEPDGTVTRRALRKAPSPSAGSASEAQDDDAAARNPLATIVRIVVLGFVAAVIGALIWLLATQVLDDGASGAIPTTIVDTTTEESSAS